MDHQALKELEAILYNSTLTAPFAAVVERLTIIKAGLTERDSFRDRLAALEGAAPADTTAPDALPANVEKLSR